MTRVSASFVVILKSLGRPEIDPILVLPDGPGGEGTSRRQLFYNTLNAPFRGHRDIILFDRPRRRLFQPIAQLSRSR